MYGCDIAGCIWSARVYPFFVVTIIYCGGALFKVNLQVNVFYRTLVWTISRLDLFTCFKQPFQVTPHILCYASSCKQYVGLWTFLRHFTAANFMRMKLSRKKIPERVALKVAVLKKCLKKIQCLDLYFFKRYMLHGCAFIKDDSTVYF